MFYKAGIFMLLLMITTACGTSSQSGNIAENSGSNQSGNIKEETETNNAKQTIEDSQLKPSINIEVELEGMKETREAFLTKSKFGYYLYLFKGYTLIDEDGVTKIQMDYDPTFYATIEVSQEGNKDAIASAAESTLEEFGSLIRWIQTPEIVQNFSSVVYYGAANNEQKGSKQILIQQSGDKLIKYTVNSPMKEAAEGFSVIWDMLKTLEFTK